MRKKIEELRNREEGFTLVELLAVIVILGIIVAIAIPAVGSIIDRADSDAEEAEIELVIDAARLYVTTETKETNTLFEDATDDKISINVVGENSLYSKGYLELRGDSEESNYTGDKVEITKEAAKPATETEDAKPASYEYVYIPSNPSSNP